jgi:dihydroxy-acid dehydratase
MQPSYFNNQKLDIVSAFESYGKFLNKDITDFEREEIIQNSCHKYCGSCSRLYTANTMATILETMGLTIPNSSSNFLMSPEKISECKNSQITIDTLLKKDIKSLDILSKE